MLKKKLIKTSKKERAAKTVFFVSAAFSVFAVFAIVGYILYASLPAFREIGFFNFIFGSTWAPTKEFLPVEERFGILPMIAGSLCVTAGALVIGGNIGIFTAAFIAKFCPKRLKKPISRLIDFLAGIPSIIYGFFGLVVLVPLLGSLAPAGEGKGILACSVILGLMIIPTVTGITKNSIEAVPQGYYEGALALGATKQQALFRVVMPSAKSGILTGLVLGTGRAIGETMAVMMIAGNTAAFPEGLFGSIRTLTINMVLEMSYSTGLHRTALIATGAVLLIFVLGLNILLGFLRRNKKQKPRTSKAKAFVKSSGLSMPVFRVPSRPYKEEKPVFKKCGRLDSILKAVSVLFAALVLLALLFLVIFIFAKGLPHISWDFLFGKSGNSGMTLAPAFVSTGMIIGLSLAIALPVGIAAAVYLVEYAKKGSRTVKVIRLFTETLAGIPSIVFGLFGMIFFCGVLKMGYSLLAGSLTMVLIILPTIIRSTEESLISVHDSLREGSYALGAGKIRTIFKIVVPSALSGIVTAVILSIGRIVGESAALIYTAGAVAYMPGSYMDSGSSFAVMMWMFAGEGLYIDYAYATASVLLIVVGLLNGLVALTEKKLKKGKGYEAKEKRKKRQP